MFSVTAAAAPFFICACYLNIYIMYVYILFHIIVDHERVYDLVNNIQVIYSAGDWGMFCPLSGRLAALGIMGDELRAPLYSPI